MTMEEYIDQVSFELGEPLVRQSDHGQIQRAILISFRELKHYMKTPVQKTVPFNNRIDLVKVGINTKTIINVIPAQPRIGLTLGSIDSGNVFQVAAAVNTTGMIGQTSSINIGPIISEMAMAQVRNTLTTDFHYVPDMSNQVIYCTHRDPRPSHVTIEYVPEYTDVSEITTHSWEDFLVQLSVAHMKVHLGRARSKYKTDSNVTLDGEILLQEGREELKDLREKLGAKKSRVVVVN